MRALITGIGGFVGSYLLEELSANGYDVAGTYIDGQPKLSGRAVLFEADMTDQAALERTLKSYGPDIIFHLAALSDVGQSFKEPELFMEVNAGGTEKLFAAIENLGLKCTVLVVGSAQEYGIPKKTPITEEHPLNPSNPYAKSKVECERRAMMHAELNKVIVTRSFNHTGAGQPDNFVLSSFAHQIALIERRKQDPVIRVGNIDAKRDFLDVRDVVRAYRLLAEKGKGGETYNVCSGTSHRISELLTKLIGMSAMDIKVMRDEERLRPLDIPVLEGDHSKLTKDTGWKPEIPIEETLKQLLEHWRKHR